jgi:sugar phosphate isomerase/epimerase
MDNRQVKRRDFLKAGGGLLGAAIAGSAFGKLAIAAVGRPVVPFSDRAPAKELPLSFSTLGCPDWNFSAILEFAAANHYQGIEIRGILRQLDLSQCPEFNSAGNIIASRRRAEEKGLAIVDLGSSCELHHVAGAEREKNIDEGKRFIDLAHALGCPFIRVFPNKLPKDQDRAATIDLIVKGLTSLGAHAKGSGVRVLMESHGDGVESGELRSIMEQAADPGVGLVWDVYNMWSVTHESPAKVYETLKKYIFHTHIKDGITKEGKEEYRLLGQGDSPIFEAIDVLAAGGYGGYYSFEWEKLWHPEIAEPEIALADYPKAMEKHAEKSR